MNLKASARARARRTAFGRRPASMAAQVETLAGAGDGYIREAGLAVVDRPGHSASGAV